MLNSWIRAAKMWRVLSPRFDIRLGDGTKLVSISRDRAIRICRGFGERSDVDYMAIEVHGFDFPNIVIASSSGRATACLLNDEGALFNSFDRQAAKGDWEFLGCDVCDPMGCPLRLTFDTAIATKVLCDFVEHRHASAAIEWTVIDPDLDYNA